LKKGADLYGYLLLRTNIIFPMGAQAPKHRRGRRLWYSGLRIWTSDSDDFQNWTGTSLFKV